MDRGPHQCRFFLPRTAISNLAARSTPCDRIEFCQRICETEICFDLT
jgi:hypothetical protein